MDSIKDPSSSSLLQFPMRHNSVENPLFSIPMRNLNGFLISSAEAWHSNCWFLDRGDDAATIAPGPAVSQGNPRRQRRYVVVWLMHRAQRCNSWQITRPYKPSFAKSYRPYSPKPSERTGCLPRRKVPTTWRPCWRRCCGSAWPCSSRGTRCATPSYWAAGSLRAQSCSWCARGLTSPPC